MLRVRSAPAPPRRIGQAVAGSAAAHARHCAVAAPATAAGSPPFALSTRGRRADQGSNAWTLALSVVGGRASQLLKACFAMWPSPRRRLALRLVSSWTGSC
eukprot:6212111-Pleurochrysis_carterae.AAC.4